MSLLPIPSLQKPYQRSRLLTITVYIQTAYLLSLAGLFCSFMPEFAFVVSIFRLARKFDTAFALIIRDLDHSASRGHLSKTDKVRIKSLAEDTRVVAVRTASKSGYNPHPIEPSDDEDDDEATETEYDDLASTDGVEVSSLDQTTLSTNISKLYEQTISLLGDVLGDLPPQANRGNINISVGEEVEEIEL